MSLRYITVLVRLIRLPNLVIIALVLFLQRWCLVLPGMQLSGIEPGWIGYSFIVAGTVLIAAGGYMINDYFDSEIDAVNRPEKITSLRLIPLASIRTLYLLTTLAGLLSIAVAVFLSGMFEAWFIYLLAVVILFWYSYQLKKVLILGNLAIALASSFTMPAAWLFDLHAFGGWSSIRYSEINVYSGISIQITIYSLFAFLISFAREIIKDIEDAEGDSLFGCRSLAVVYGVQAAKYVILASLVLIFILLCFWQAYLISNGRPDIAIYLGITVALPLLWLSVHIFRMRTKIQCHVAGLMAKIIMVTGILSMLFFLF